MRVEELERRMVLASAAPTATLSIPSATLIGTTLDFPVSFSNTSTTQTGYAPFLDLELPSVGTDGNNGITFLGATYLGTPVTATVLTFNSSGKATHPYARDSSGNPVVISGTPGDQLVVLQLPFGSFTPGQPAATLDVAASLSNKAALGRPLNVTATGGFALGNDPLNDPTTDPSLLGTAAAGVVTPTLVLVKKTYLGPEQETATGPNFPEQYLITATVAPGQTINNFKLTDALPSNLQFVSLNAASANGSTSQTTVASPTSGTPGGSLTEQFNKVVGTGSATDASMTYTFYVPRDNASGQPVLNLNTGAFATAVGSASASGSWTPLNTLEPTTTVTSNIATDTLTGKSVAVQKTVTDLTHPNSPQPGDVLQYTINFQVSDEFAFQNLLATDVFSDGQHFNTAFTPTLTFTQHGTTLPASAFQPANVNVQAQNTTTGTTTIAFNVSNELLARGISGGNLLGGAVPAGGTGGPEPPAMPPLNGTTGSITFETVIQQRYDYNYPSGEPYVVEGDVLTNTVNAGGNVLSYANLAPSGSAQSDNSSASVVIPRGTLNESIYAINGNTSFATPVKVAAGDTVTYRMQYDLSTSNIDTLTLSSFLPLPIMNATSLTTFDNVTSATAPAVGHLQFGPNDTYHAISGIVPTLSTDGTANSLTLNYGSFHDPSQQPSVVDVLYTVAVSNNPFADGLFLTNQAHEYESSTNDGTATSNNIVQLQLTEPSLSITQGAVAVNDPKSHVNATPYGFSAPGTSGTRFTGTINSNTLTTSPIKGGVTNVQAGDLVTFATVVQNTGSGLNGAFNVTLKDALPAGFVVPSTGLNLNVTNGAGSSLAFTNVGGGTGLFDQGIELVDPNGIGALAPYSPTSGNNVLVITYDLQVSGSVTPREVIPNTGSLTNYASTEGGTNFLSAPATASATAAVDPVTLTKALTATNQTFTSGNQLAIGEIATYDVTATIPQGVTPNAVLVDTLPAGLAIVGVDSITPSSSNLTSSEGTWANVTNSDVAIGANGASATFTLGNITNADSTLGQTDTLTIQYRVVALNVAGNQQGTTVRNSAVFTYTGGSVSASAPAVIVTPTLGLSVTPSQRSAQAGDTETFTVVVSNLAANGSGADAYDVALSDLVPTGLTYVPNSLTNTAGTAPSTLSASGATLTASYTDLPLGATSTLTFQATVDSSTGPYQTLTDTASASYTTLPGSVTTAQSTYNTVSTERTGSTSNLGGSVNNLNVNASAAVNTVDPTMSKVVLSTNLGSTTGNNVAIGEEVEYQVTLTIPDGTTQNAVLTDTLPAGLAVVGVDSVTASSSLSTSATGGFAGVGTSATVGNSGGLLTLNFGTLTNANVNSAQPQTIVVTYTTVVLNTAGNQQGTALQNVATFAVQGGSATASAPNVMVVEPVVAVSLTPSASKGDAGGVPITFTILVSAMLGTGADAYNVNLSDVIPSGYSYVPNSLVNTSGLAPTSLSASASTLNAGYADLAPGVTSTLQFQAELSASTTPGQAVADSASLTYTSLPSGVTTAQSNYNALSTGRTGNTTDPGGSANTYLASANTSVTVNSNSLSGFVYEDSNDDGVMQPGEPGVSGVTVFLTGQDNLGNPVNASMTTSASGAYTFTGLRPGTYALTTTPPAGDLNGTDSAGTPFGGTSPSPNLISGISIPQGTNNPGTAYNFAVLKPASIAGTVFSDLNNNGVVNTGEPGLSGVTVTLTGTNDLGASVNTSLTTDSSGHFDFTNLRPGRYTVTETPPSGELPGTNSPGNTGGTFSGATLSGVTLAEGTLDTGVTFAELTPAVFSGVVFHDANDDGIPQSGEPGLAGVAVTLTGTNDLGHSVSLGTTTAADGSYSFTNLRPGVYAVTETPPSGLLPGKATPGPLGGTVPGRDVISGVTLSPGSSATGNDLAILSPASLSGSVYIDTNNNGLMETGEPGVSSVIVTLTGTDDLGNLVNQTMTTASDGSYAFNNLEPGQYAVSATVPSGDLSGKATAGSLGGNVTTPDAVSGVALTPGASATGNNLAVLQPSSLSGVVFQDANNDGVPQSGEPGISGVVVTLTGTNDRGNSVSATTTTAVDGSYSFNGLRPGTYTLSAATPPGDLAGKDTPGTSGGTPGVASISTIVVNEGTAGSGNTFADLLPSSLSGVVYNDANDNGVQNTGEAGIAGVPVTLSGTDDLGHAVSLATTTASDGTYAFLGLRPGLYTLTETPPVGDLNGTDASGSLGGTVGTDQVQSITVTPGASGTGYDFAELQPSSLSGVVFSDLNNDGIPQSGEPGLGGVLVTLTGTNDQGVAVNQTTQTLADGSYTLSNLRPGRYELAATTPTGNLVGKATAGVAGGAVAGAGINAITLPSATSGTGYNFGELAPSSLSGYVYVNSSDNGVWSPGAPGIAGVLVTLHGTTDQGMSVTETTSTGANGSYAFHGLRPGSYTLEETLPSNVLAGTNVAGSLGGTVSPGAISAVTLPPGGSGTGYNFAELKPSSLSGDVYLDHLDNGLKQASDPGLAGVTVTLSGVDDHGNVVNQSVRTAIDGSYAFQALRPGRYVLIETPPPGVLDGAVAAGSQGGVPATHLIGQITLGSGVSGTSNNFAELMPSTISGLVQVLMTGGVRERGLGGVTIHLTGNDDHGAPVSLWTTSAANGAYAFSNLRPSSSSGYVLTETPPPGYRFASAIPGTTGGIAADSSGGSIVEIAAAQEPTPFLSLNNDFALIAPPSLIVTNVQRYGLHNEPTELVVTFSGALDPASAQAASNYTLLLRGNGRILPITSAVYDATTDSVTLIPARSFNVHYTNELTVGGAVTDVYGNSLLGNGVTPGTSFVTTVNRSNLAGFLDQQGRFIPVNHGQFARGTEVLAPPPGHGSAASRIGYPVPVATRSVAHAAANQGGRGVRRLSEAPRSAPPHAMGSAHQATLRAEAIDAILDGFPVHQHRGKGNSLGVSRLL